MTNALFLLTSDVESAEITASSENATAPAENIRNLQRTSLWRSGVGSSSYLDITMPTQRPRSYVAIVDTNLTLEGTIHVEAWDDEIDGAVQTVDITVAPTLYSDPDEPGIPWGVGAWGVGPWGLPASEASVNSRNVTLIALPEIVESTFWRITFADDNTNYQECGVLYIAAPKQFVYNLSYSWSAEPIEQTVFKKALGGQRFSNPRESPLELRGQFEFLSNTERADMLVQIRRIGKHRPFIFSVIPEATDEGLTSTVFGCFSEWTTSQQHYDTNVLSVAVVEEL